MNLKGILSITKRELRSAFSSPVALIFIGIFLAINLFIFFTHSRFFLRGIADVRPLFEWIPILLIFLGSAVTMRAWSEESRSGTLELLLTLPLRSSTLVLGKFFACLTLVAVALALTIPLPITVAYLGPLDIGPVWGAYIASLLLASAYLSIGLFVSAVNDNQIISLMLSMMICGLLYFIGSDVLLAFVGQELGSLFVTFGTGTRFDSIERGVLDFRDLAYLLSLSGVFLYFNTVAIEYKRMERAPLDRASRWRIAVTTGVLIVGNLIFANLHLNQMDLGRIDLTEERLFSISDLSREVITSLDEPILISCYISQISDPQLSLLIPQIRDQLREYEELGEGKVRVQFITPEEDREVIKELESTYQVKPYQITLTSRAKVISDHAYFHIIFHYGDTHKVIRFNDLVDLEKGPTGVEFHLKGLEYVITNTIKTISEEFSSLESVMATQPVTFTAYVSSAQKFSAKLQEFSGASAKIYQAFQELKMRAQQSGGTFNFQLINPDNLDAVTRQKLIQEVGVKPRTFVDGQKYWLTGVIEVGNRSEQVSFWRVDMRSEKIAQVIEAALRRCASGFSKTVGIVTHSKSPDHPQMPYGMSPPPPKEDYQVLQSLLSKQFQVRSLKLKDRLIPDDIDVLILAKIGDLSADQKLLIDQYLMRGGAVIALVGARDVELERLSRNRRIPPQFKDDQASRSLSALLEHYGVHVGEGYALDVQGPEVMYPTRDRFNRVSAVQLPYPYFVQSTRERLMSSGHPALRGLTSVLLMWPTSLSVAEDLDSEIQSQIMLSTSAEGWVDLSNDLSPWVKRPEAQEPGVQTLALTMRGRFSSAFLPKVRDGQGVKVQDAEKAASKLYRDFVTRGQLLTQSPPDTRLAVIGSSEFVSDQVFEDLGPYYTQYFGLNLEYQSGLPLLENLIDWMTSDQALAALRKSGPSSRVLRSLSDEERDDIEMINYLSALIALVLISAFVVIPRRLRAKGA